MSKAETTPLTAPHEWAAVEEAFDRIMTYARERNYAGRCLNEDLRSGRLRSAWVVVSGPCDADHAGGSPIGRDPAAETAPRTGEYT